MSAAGCELSCLLHGGEQRLGAAGVGGLPPPACSPQRGAMAAPPEVTTSTVQTEEEDAWWASATRVLAGIRPLFFFFLCKPFSDCCCLRIGVV